jgi:uncharacterized membrane protein YdjX (TVP38/TMEM64 family)
MQKHGSKTRFFSTNKTTHRVVHDHTDNPKPNLKAKIWTILIFVVSIVVVVLFLYLDRHNALSRFLRSLGSLGVILAIIFKALITVTPVPTEGILIIYMKVYGVWWGVLYSWIGGILSSFLIFVAARHVGQPLLQSVITKVRFEQVDNWVKKRGVVGLLMMRLLPIPGFVSSYILGMIPSVGLWPYVWTEAVSVIPYYVGTALIFLGVSAHLTIWLAIGGFALVLFWALGYFYRKKFIS